MEDVFFARPATKMALSLRLFRFMNMCYKPPLNNSTLVQRRQWLALQLEVLFCLFSPVDDKVSSCFLSLLLTSSCLLLLTMPLLMESVISIKSSKGAEERKYTSYQVFPFPRKFFFCPNSAVSASDQLLL